MSSMSTMTTPTTPTTPTTAWLAGHVVKDGVMLGGLTDPQRTAALALVWAALPPAAACTEAGINAVLKAQLEGAARSLDTDHVELRRWLVDTGFLQRDGYGRRYEQTALHALPPAAREAADQVLAALGDQAPAAWAAGLRQERADSRASRRAAWQAAQPTAHPVG